jgi:hypothetical protein
MWARTNLLFERILLGFFLTVAGSPDMGARAMQTQPALSAKGARAPQEFLKNRATAKCYLDEERYGLSAKWRKGVTAKSAPLVSEGDLQGNTAQFLCISDCLAEREGFEPSVQFSMANSRGVRKLQIRLA